MLRSHFSLFFATDLHGSERCFRKFVNSARFYGADALFLGGDLAGKSVIPVWRDKEGNWVAQQDGGERKMSHTEIVEFENAAKDSGQYLVRESPRELAELNCVQKDKLFRQVATQRLREWLDYAASKLTTGTLVYAIPGNDDPFDFNSIFSEYSFIRFLDATATEIAPELWVVGLGGSNPTPWNTYREMSEEEIAGRLRSTFAAVPSTATTILHCHAPPLGSGLDNGPMLDKNLKVQVGVGGPRMVALGSIAVRRTVEQMKPCLGLFGHVHESRAVTRLGNSLCVNPGSQFWTGNLFGFWATIRDRQVINWRLTEG